MRLFALTTLTMFAFAANSVLNRLAVGGELIGPLGFAMLRLLAGAAMLGALVGLRHARSGIAPKAPRQIAQTALGAGSLLVYLFGFSLAYGALDAGGGALILFGAVQITMFAGAFMLREPVPWHRWAGSALAFGGLVVLLVPGGGGDPPGLHAAAMALAGIGWGIYSLAGRGTRDALGATAANFIFAVPVGVALALSLGLGAMTAAGAALAALSGALASGAGYALWYALLPRLGAARGAVAQLTVPLIAAAGGAVLIGEPISWRFGVASALVLGGVGFAALSRHSYRS
ncbi:DMT family transporter [Phaeovulum sp.]|uniref:DMT family transporter n=1 Tax=Phaeovulum sp. TaxID=2934796 RepID=UPI0027321374|nr:DMT family transporter [Phaeovulum sp.]MDP1668350.1 DMT family transporter [Phaeovulum sp.]MDZ4117941.1 DMT family transporter [Phaeovulum sp.]